MIMSRIEGQMRNEWIDGWGGRSHSSAFSTLFSIASAGLPKTVRQTFVWMDMSAGRKRISRLGAFDDDSARQLMSSSTRVPTR